MSTSAERIAAGQAHTPDSGTAQGLNGTDLDEGSGRKNGTDLDEGSGRKITLADLLEAFHDKQAALEPRLLRQERVQAGTHEPGWLAIGSRGTLTTSS